MGEHGQGVIAKAQPKLCQHGLARTQPKPCQCGGRVTKHEGEQVHRRGGSPVLRLYPQRGVSSVQCPGVQMSSSYPSGTRRRQQGSSLRGSAEASPTTERCACKMRVQPVPVTRQEGAGDTGLTGACSSVGQGRCRKHTPCQCGWRDPASMRSSSSEVELQMCVIADARKKRGDDDDNKTGLTKGPKAHSCQLRAMHE
jgi:hypothetical protein